MNFLALCSIFKLFSFLVDLGARRKLKNINALIEKINGRLDEVCVFLEIFVVVLVFIVRIDRLEHL